MDAIRVLEELSRHGRVVVSRNESEKHRFCVSLSCTAKTGCGDMLKDAIEDVGHMLAEELRAESQKRQAQSDLAEKDATRLETMINVP